MKKSKKPLTIPQLFIERVHKNNENQLLGWIEHEEVKFFSQKEYWSRVKFLCLGLAQQGVKKGDKVAILARTSKEWHLFDLSLLCLGAVVVPIYPSYEGDDLNYILEHSEAKFVIAENSYQLHKISPLLKSQKIKKCFIIQNEQDSKVDYNHCHFYEQIITDAQSQQSDSDAGFLSLCQDIKEEDLATIIYTSGTTGEPKGAMITQGAIIAMLENIYTALKGHLSPKDRTLTFLPLSHVLGRCDSLIGLKFNLQNIYAESLEKVIDNITIAQPTIMIAVPRIFEKIFEGIHQKMADEDLLKKGIFKWAVNASENYFSKIDNDRAPKTIEILQRNLAYKLVFQKIYQRFGGKIRFFVSGGAPLNEEVIRFLRYCNLTVLEGYGLTETIAPCAVNPVNKQIPGTVGLPLGDVQIKFDQDGEILIKTKALFHGYYKNPKETDAVLDDGWFRTGDIGELNSHGYLKITDRKKDIIITSGGKNIAPQKIEGFLKIHPEISQAIVIGDKRKYLTALIFIEKAGFLEQLEAMGLDRHASLEEICQKSEVQATIKKLLEQTNERLASFERIKEFRLIPVEPSVDNGMMTPSLKIRRKIILTEFKQLIDSMY